MKKSHLWGPVLALTLGLVSLAIQPASAISFETNATRDTFSGVASDPQGPATTGSILSQVIVPPSDGTGHTFTGSDAFARGAANDTGAGAVGVDGVFFSGEPTVYSLTATSVLTSELTNTTGGNVPFAYEFFLPGPVLTISDFAGMSETDDPTIRAFFDFRVSLDFGSGFVPHVISGGELTGGLVSHNLSTAGTDPLGSTFFTDINFPNNIFGYRFDDLSDTITGFLPAGQTVAVQASLFVSLGAPGFETGGAAAIGDPLDLSSGAFSGSLNIVPIPPAVWLFGTGLIGLFGMARRKAA